MKMTSNEIAKLANISRATVYRVINNKPGVKDDTKKLVQKIIEKYNYEPNIVGKVLANQNRPYRIGVVLPPDNNNFYQKVRAGINDAFYQYMDMGIVVVYEVMAEYSVESQKKSLITLLEQDIDALAVYGFNDKEIRNVINEMFMDIPIVTFITDIEGIDRLCFVGHDLVKGGRVAATLVSKLTRSKGRVVVLTTSMKLQAHIDRIKGFKDKINESYPGIEIVGIYENFDGSANNYDILAGILSKDKNIDAIYSTSGLGMAGIENAIKEFDYANKACVVTFDFTPDTVRLLNEGVVDFSIGQEPYYEGFTTIKVLSDYLVKGVKPEEEFMKTKIDIRTVENID